MATEMLEAKPIENLPDRLLIKSVVQNVEMLGNCLSFRIIFTTYQHLLDQALKGNTARFYLYNHEEILAKLISLSYKWHWRGIERLFFFNTSQVAELASKYNLPFYK